MVWWFGFVSLAADMVYEGARSVYGPLLEVVALALLVDTFKRSGPRLRAG